MTEGYLNCQKTKKNNINKTNENSFMTKIVFYVYETFYF